MKRLNIDIETYSSVNLSKSGVYKYAESEDFEVLLFAYSVDDDETQVIDIANGEAIPSDILNALRDEKVIKWAFNAQFERVCLSKHLGLGQGKYLSAKSWRCTSVWSAYMGLPLSLEGVGAVLCLEKQKLSEGKDLIRYFCLPCLPTKTNGGRTRNLPKHAEDKWQQFKDYNKRDVDTEKEIQQKLHQFKVPDTIWEEYLLDQDINDRGILIDVQFVEQAISQDEKIRHQLLLDLQQLTGLENPNSVTQLKSWLKEQQIEVDSLDKKSVMKLVGETKGQVSVVLAMRLKLAKSSIKKYQAMKHVVCLDNRCHGMFQFLGANRTGRFAGRLVQLQNLPQNHMIDLKRNKRTDKSK